MNIKIFIHQSRMYAYFRDLTNFMFMLSPCSVELWEFYRGLSWPKIEPFNFLLTDKDLPVSSCSESDLLNRVVERNFRGKLVGSSGDSVWRDLRKGGLTELEKHFVRHVILMIGDLKNWSENSFSANERSAALQCGDPPRKVRPWFSEHLLVKGAG